MLLFFINVFFEFWIYIVIWTFRVINHFRGRGRVDKVLCVDKVSFKGDHKGIFHKCCSVQL